ncbi:MAG: WYL domain-containing protein [Syntrophotaleaceae bacterium]
MAAKSLGRRGKPAKKYSQAARLHDVIRLLEARHGTTVDELAEECGVNRRTIYRDLAVIEEAGYPLVKETGTDGRVLYRFLTGFSKIPPITFSLPELMTLFLCRGQLAFLQGTPFQDDLDAVFSRIRAGLPPRSVAHLERLAEVVTPRFQGLRDYREKRQILEELRQALLFQYRATIRYAPPNRPARDYPIDPYTLLFYQNALYLGGYAHNRKDLRLFLLDRIQEVTVSRERFELPENFSTSHLTGAAFGLVDDTPMEIRVRFSPEVAHLIRERVWHSSQSQTDEADGSVVLSFYAGGEKEILAWLYSFLPHVEVLAPPNLRQSFYRGLAVAIERSGLPDEV